ncbi:DUF3116 domain-containing protein, partial [Listeria monocytogenes]|nr:DUF3116 domain-containing protein [Listeria monocytogenes]ECQ0695655.1 DUF3116 domain-containing protein [Listeria monocytogenes]MCK32767.1 hypothetical protein [Listeria monocytogenes]
MERPDNQLILMVLEVVKNP